jgi:mRNA-degrading endonuclease HigB of HigAB toxin-antitoxin module
MLLDVYTKAVLTVIAIASCALVVIDTGQAAIAGNKYRIVLWINCPYRVVGIRFIGTHHQYDAIDAQTV